MFACYRPILNFNIGYTKAETSLFFILEGGMFWLIVRVIFTVFNINIPFFVSWKPYAMLVQLACHRWSTNLLDVNLIEENKLDGCQRRELLFIVPGWFITYFHILTFEKNEQYGEDEMSQAVVFLYVFAFNFALTLYPLELY